jgi:outer membrane immunogenic protein
MQRLILAGALAFAAAGQALAADLPQAPPPPQAPATYIPVVAPVYNWGGIYWGINGGYGFGNSEWTNPFFPPGSSGTFSLSGGLVGGTLGVNFQSDAWVFGVEGDFDASWINGTETNAFCVVACETKNTWLGTFRGRIGYAADRVLFYGTGGLAYGNIEAGVTGGPFDKSTEPGWTAGAGVEAAFADNWTARIEYLFVDLENGSCVPASCGTGQMVVNTTNATVKFDTSLIRLGLDYKFR